MKKNNTPIYILIGTRAQLIKTAPVMVELEDRNIKYEFIYTEQHKITFKRILDNFQINTKPRNLINSHKEGKTISGFLKWFIKIILLILNPFNSKKIFNKGKGIVLVHGDTASTALGAILAKTRGQKVAHLESGLRSFNLLEPFPEEIQRLITFRFTDIYFSPNKWSQDNLLRYKGEKINTKQNTLLDSVRIALENKVNLNKLKLPEKFGLISIHRYENLFRKERFEFIVKQIEEVSKIHNVVFVLHPVTEKKLEKENILDKLKSNKRITLIPRQDFFTFVTINNKAEFVVTDGGSNQEEMSYIGKPTLLMREKTERIEGLGENILISKLNADLVNMFITNFTEYSRKPLIDQSSPSKIVVDTLLNYEK